LVLIPNSQPAVKSTIRNATVATSPNLSLSGLPANDERVTDIIRLGRNEMPGYSQTLNSQDIQDLLAYLHSL
jgi:mono/diheme cytochrome c family protein